MYGKFGRIDYSETTFVENTFHKYQSIDSSSDGVSLIHLRRQDKQPPHNDWSPLTTSGSHWASIHNLFYRSGSKDTNQDEQSKFEQGVSNHYSIVQSPTQKGMYVSKFYDSASVIYIPQQYFGERIKPQTFEIIFRTGSKDNVTKQLKIRDDGFGNLYATNADVYHFSSTSGSDETDNPRANYIGNIFYDLGVVTITETGSVFQTSPSTASITCGVPGLQANDNHFFISNSVGTPFKFIGTDNSTLSKSLSDSSEVYYFVTGSSTTVTAASASKKINQVFGGVVLSASSNSNVVTLSNDANILVGRKTSGIVSNSFDGDTHREDLGPISGSGGFNVTKGFGGGTPVVNYTDLGGNNKQDSCYNFYNVFFDSVTPIFTTEFSIKIPADQFNMSLNPSSTPALPSGSLPSGSDYGHYATLNSNLTGSGWTPYFNQIHFFRNDLGIEEPIITANLPRNIKKRDDMDLIITFRIDH